MVLNKLEQAVLALFFESELMEIVNGNLNKAEITDREFTGVGFITQIQPNQVKILKGPASFTGGRIGAKLNSSIDVGFVIYIKDSYVDALEGYTEDGEWPDKIDWFDLSIINFNGKK